MKVPLLKKLLNRSCCNVPRMTADEGKEHPWDTLEAKKYLIPSENQNAICCPTCYKFADVGWMNIKGRGNVPYASCAACGFYEIEPQLLRTWMVRLETVLERVVEQLELRGGIQVHVPNLIWRLGRKRNREYLYIRRYNREEQRMIRSELSKMPNAVLVTGTQLILKHVRFDHDHASFSLESVTSWDEQCEMVIDFDALRDIIGADDTSDKKSKSKPAPKRGQIAVNTEKLIKELEQFLKDARDHVLANAERDDIAPLPRPSKVDLAKRTGLSKWAVSRCFSDENPNAKLLNLLWEQANDLKSILR